MTGALIALFQVVLDPFDVRTGDFLMGLILVSCGFCHVELESLRHMLFLLGI